YTTLFRSDFLEDRRDELLVGVLRGLVQSSAYGQVLNHDRDVLVLSNDVDLDLLRVVEVPRRAAEESREEHGGRSLLHVHLDHASGACVRHSFLLARTHRRTPGLRNEAPRDVLVTLRMIVCVGPQRRLLTSQKRCDPVVTGCRVVTVA